MKRAGKAGRVVLLVFLALGTLGVFGYVFPAAWADAASLSVRWEISQWREGRVRMPGAFQWGRVRAGLLHAAAITPDNAQLHDDLGFIHALRAQSVADNPDLQDLHQALLAEAEAHYRNAARLRPMFPYGWAHLALARHQLGKRDATLWQAYDNAYAYGRNETGVQLILAEIALGNWTELGAQRQADMLDVIEKSAPHVRPVLLLMATSAGVAPAASDGPKGNRGAWPSLKIGNRPDYD